MNSSKKPSSSSSFAPAPKVQLSDRIRRSSRSFIIFLLFGVVVTFIGLPIVALFANVTLQGFLNSFSTELVVEALKLSFLTTMSTLAIVIIFGTPVAYFNARHSYHGKRVIETIIDLPIVLPPAVAGIALLLAFGRRGLLGQYFGILGINIAFTAVAVVMAQIFVSCPFYIRQATTSFEDVDPEYERAARTLGASSAQTFFRVTVPIALNGMVSGALMTWARALGEFGATILFAGNFQGVTQTMPLAIYTALDSNLDSAVYIAAILVLISFAVIISVKLLGLREKAGTQDEESVLDFVRRPADG